MSEMCFLKFIVSVRACDLLGAAIVIVGAGHQILATPLQADTTCEISTHNTLLAPSTGNTYSISHYISLLLVSPVSSEC
jgi:hypothetical protein